MEGGLAEGGLAEGGIEELGVAVAGLERRVLRWSLAGGLGPSVLALHGFSGSGVDFAPLAERLGGTWHAPDLLGHAGSATPGEERFAFAAQVADLSAQRRALGLERPLLVGYSFGGRLALGLLAREPEAYAGAVLIGATAGIEERGAREVRRADDWLRADLLRRLGAPAFLAAWARRPLLATQARIAPAAQRRMAAARALHGAEGLARTLRRAGTGSMPPLWGELRRVSTPTLVLSGAEDPKFGALAERLCGALPRGARALVAGAGHCAHLEAPDAAGAEVRAWASLALEAPSRGGA